MRGNPRCSKKGKPDNPDIIVHVSKGSKCNRFLFLQKINVKHSETKIQTPKGNVKEVYLII
jgi:hypothetical protein